MGSLGRTREGCCINHASRSLWLAKSMWSQLTRCSSRPAGRPQPGCGTDSLAGVLGLTVHRGQAGPADLLEVGCCRQTRRAAFVHLDQAQARCLTTFGLRLGSGQRAVGRRLRRVLRATQAKPDTPSVRDLATANPSAESKLSGGAPMSPTEPSDGKMRLVRPRSSWRGFHITAAVIIFVSVILAWCGTQYSHEPPPSTTAADIVDLTRQLEKGALGQQAAEARAAASTASTSNWVVKGVPFDVTVPTGWSTDRDPNQVFVKEQTGGRVCQISGSGQFDLPSFLTEAKGKEAELEAAYIREAVTMGVVASGGTAHVNVVPRLLTSSHDNQTFHYVVAATVSMQVGTATRQSLNIVSLSARGTDMVRIQCADLGNVSDRGDSMTSIASSLRLL